MASSASAFRSVGCRSSLLPRECCSMLLTMPSARRPCSTIFSRFPVSKRVVSTISAHLAGSSALTARAASFSSSNSSTERPAKLLTKLRGFLISWAIPAVTCPSAAIFCAHQACLRHLQFAQCLLGGVPGCANSFLGTLALGDVAVDHYEAAACDRVAAHLDDATVRAGPFEAHLPAGLFDGAAQLRFEISRDVLAAAGEIAEKLGEARPPREEGVGQLEHLLKIAVPRGEPRLGIEHDDAVAHVVEGDAQLGLAIPQLVEEPCILYRDHRLVGEGGGQLNLLIRKWSDMCAEKTEKTDLRVAAQQRHGQNGSISPDTPPLRQGVFGIRHHVGDVNGTL